MRWDVLTPGLLTPGLVARARSGVARTLCRAVGVEEGMRDACVVGGMGWNGIGDGQVRVRNRVCFRRSTLEGGC